VTEEDARLALLQTEINAVQNSINALDTITFQIKGWCVTAALAIGGFAVAYHKPALLIVGAGAVVGFYLMNCQFKMIQRAFINRNKALDSELKSTGLMEVLRGAGNLSIVGIVVPRSEISRIASSKRVWILQELPALLYEASLPNTFSLYLFIMVCLGVEAITLI
jgi:hypothetical protein